MISVLAHKAGAHLPVRGPAVGLFIDLEVRYVAGPVVVAQPYLVEHTVVGIGQSKRVESYWTETTLTDATPAPTRRRCCCTRVSSRPPTPTIRPPDPPHIRTMSDERDRCAHLSSLVFFGVDHTDLARISSSTSIVEMEVASGITSLSRCPSRMRSMAWAASWARPR